MAISEGKTQLAIVPVLDSREHRSAFLRALLRRGGWTTPELEAVVGVDQGTLRQYLRGVRDVRPAHVQPILSVLGGTPGEIAAFLQGVEADYYKHECDVNYREVLAQIEAASCRDFSRRPVGEAEAAVDYGGVALNTLCRPEVAEAFVRPVYETLKAQSGIRQRIAAGRAALLLSATYRMEGAYAQSVAVVRQGIALIGDLDPYWRMEGTNTLYLDLLCAWPQEPAIATKLLPKHGDFALEHWRPTDRVTSSGMTGAQALSIVGRDGVQGMIVQFGKDPSQEGHLRTWIGKLETANEELTDPLARWLGEYPRGRAYAALGEIDRAREAEEQMRYLLPVPAPEFAAKLKRLQAGIALAAGEPDAEAKLEDAARAFETCGHRARSRDLRRVLHRLREAGSARDTEP